VADHDETRDTNGAAEPAWPSDDRDSGNTGDAGAAGADHATYELPRPQPRPSGHGRQWSSAPPPPPPARGRPGDEPTVIQPAVFPRAGNPARPMRIEPSGEQHPAAATTGDEHDRPADRSADTPAGPPPDSGADEQPQPRPPRRRRRGLLVGALVLVLLLVAGGVLALPDVSNRLALPWAPNAPKAAPPEPVAVTRTLPGPDTSAPAPTPDGVAQALSGPAGNADLGTLSGTVVDPAAGEVLWERDAAEPRTPASTTKLLTTAAALLALGPDKQLSTKVVAGEDPGTVVLVAGGDITLSSLPEGQDSVYAGAAHLDDLVAQVKESTGGSVERVRLDLSLFTGESTAPGWAPEDVPSTYMAAVVPAMLDGGLTDPTDTHSMRFDNPARVLAEEFAQRLGAEVAEDSTTTAADGAKVLGEVRSAPMRELVDTALILSDNLLAEVLARQVAIATGAEPSFAGAAQATLDVLSRNGFDVSDVELSDGSGLSTRNRIPAKVLGEILTVAAAPLGEDPRTETLRPILGGLPVAGGSGTLAGRYDSDAADEGKGWVRAKTGTLTGVNTLAGQVLTVDDRVLVFAFMSDGPDILAAREALDALAAALRECGCR
jgi:D-alanyl-D-alanine carboxypeptidase/D-alanyl-D-alanine-endopeptidase (penicillin-binding protein 4)